MLLNRERSFGADTRVGAYWLANCHGFAVDGPGVCNGAVEDVLFLEPGGPAAYLVVRVDGLVGARRRTVAAAEIAEVDPWRNVVRLRGTLRRCVRRTRREHGRIDQATFA